MRMALGAKRFLHSTLFPLLLAALCQLLSAYCSLLLALSSGRYAHGALRKALSVLDFLHPTPFLRLGS